MSLCQHIVDVEVDAKLIPETFRTKKPTKRGYNETFKEIRQVLYTQYGFIRNGVILDVY
jgi:hypothetical protein